MPGTPLAGERAPALLSEAPASCQPNVGLHLNAAASAGTLLPHAPRSATRLLTAPRPHSTSTVITFHLDQLSRNQALRAPSPVLLSRHRVLAF